MEPKRGVFILTSVLLLLLAHGIALLYRVEFAVSLWFPPSGVSIAVALWLGPIGALITAIVSIVMAPFWGSDGWFRWTGAIDGIEPLIAWALYRKYFRASLTFESLRDAVAFIISAPAIACGCLAVMGSFTLHLLGKIPESSLERSIEHWWLGNAIGTMAIAPTLLLVLTPILQRWGWLKGDREISPVPPSDIDRPTPRQYFEFLGIVLISVITSRLTVLQSGGNSNFALQQLSLLSFVPILWGAVRFGDRGGMLVASLTVLATLLNYLLLYPDAVNLSRFPVPPETLHIHKLSLLIQCAVALLVGTAISDRAAARAELAVQEALADEYRVRAALSDKLFHLNRSLQDTNQRLQESEELFRTSVENMLDCFGIYRSIRDDNGNIVDFSVEYVNRAACENNQLTREEQIGRRLSELLPGHTRSGLLAEYRQVVETGQPLVKDSLVYEDAYGGEILTRAFDIRVTKYGDGFIATWRDITDRHLADVLIRTVLDNFPNGGVFVFDSRYRYILARGTGLASAGITPEYLEGKTIHESLPPKSLAAIEPAYRKALAGTPSRVEAPFLDRIYDVQILPLKNDRGEIIVGMAITQDITDRVRVEESLIQKQRRLDLAQAVAKAGTFEWDMQKNINIWSKELETLYGLREGEFAGTFEAWERMVYPEDLPKANEEIRKALETGEFNTDWRIVRPDGEIRWMNARAKIFYDGEGKPAYMVGINMDITERKAIESDLKRQARELERLNASLVNTGQLLSQRNQELDRFVYVVSHDLKAPLRAIANLSEWIEEDLEGQLPEDSRRQMELLRNRVGRLVSLIDGLLVYSRVGRTEVRAETFAVGHLLEEVIDSLAPPAIVSIEIGAGMPTLTTKKLLMAQVFSNLIGNAIKHNDRPDGKISISVTPRGDFYEFSVRDNGPGIPAEHHERIFGIFETLNSRDKKESTGIGLSIVKKIIDTEGGTIHVESAVGKGATFRFTWPESDR